MTNKVFRTINGRTDTRLVSASQATKMVARGWMREEPSKPAKKTKAKRNADKA